LKANEDNKNPTNIAKTTILSEFNTQNKYYSKKKSITSELNDTINQIDVAGIYRIFHPTAAEYTFFSEAYGTFSIIGNILGHKAILNKYKKVEITSCILPNHNGIKLEICSK
jgi:hypothetical protein